MLSMNYLVSVMSHVHILNWEVGPFLAAKTGSGETGSY